MTGPEEGGELEPGSWLGGGGDISLVQTRKPELEVQHPLKKPRTTVRAPIFLTLLDSGAHVLAPWFRGRPCPKTNVDSG